MRRLIALAITMGLAWLVVARFGVESGNSGALALGVALVAASIVGWLCEFIRLPRITGYLAFGLICGPSLFNIITDPMARDLESASGFAVVVIAVIAGLHINFAKMRPRLNTVATIAMGRWWWPGWSGPVLFSPGRFAVRARSDRLAARGGGGLTATLLVGASPAVTVAVIREPGAWPAH